MVHGNGGSASVQRPYLSRCTASPPAPSLGVFRAELGLTDLRGARMAMPTSCSGRCCQQTTLWEKDQARQQQING